MTQAADQTVMYVISKIAALLIQPSSLAVMALAFGLWLSRRPAGSILGRRLSVGALLFLVIGGIVPIGNWLVIPLEQRFADVKPLNEGDEIAGIIILGGFEDGWVTAGRHGLAINEAAERLTEAVRLAHRFPKARVVFSGGVGLVFKEGVGAAEPVAEYLRSVGIEAARIATEGKSRNTRENALYSRELLQPRSGERWALVTSAAHMPRAMGVFRTLGFEVMAHPVDYRTRSPGDAFRLFDSMPSGFQRLDMAAKEWISLVYYRLRGWTTALFPAP
jgi:uncharacterized SAM-binding protein YcdF (DUF218 family)